MTKKNGPTKVVIQKNTTNQWQCPICSKVFPSFQTSIDHTTQHIALIPHSAVFIIKGT